MSCSPEDEGETPRNWVPDPPPVSGHRLAGAKRREDPDLVPDTFFLPGNLRPLPAGMQLVAFTWVQVFNLHMNHLGPGLPAG